ncbi:MAG: hypothetical protein BJ554DRAFT_1595 [Olpidium bornovanus]|uniref:Uncharacterized protein n=1 Tax=Olpidium bornovanus TaxID=278681 RepID=A0A8H7ZS37_9FUNG|nr:MAG: hypothetical protein BJ554DRAFT_1595 [Olpidium bornovanus]
MGREELLEVRVRQLERRKEDVETAAEVLWATKLKEKDRIDARQGKHPRPLVNRDWVLRRNDRVESELGTHRKFVRRWFGPYMVLKAFSTTGTYELRELDGMRLAGRVAAKHLKLFRQRDGKEYELGTTGDGGLSNKEGQEGRG